MNNTLLISVIIPCFNSEDTIVNTLDSLANQTLKNFEVIVINDGSKDNTQVVVENYKKKSKLNIRIYNQPNSGVSVARNLGISKVKTKYITFLDSDDAYLPNFLSTLFYVIEKHEVDTAYCSFTRNIEDTNDKEKSLICLEHNELLRNFQLRKIPCNMWSFIYKTDIVQEANINFTPGLKYGEDNEFVWKYLSHCETGCASPLQLYFYNDNPYSAINNISWDIDIITETTMRISKYLEVKKDPFLSNFNKYNIPKNIWSLARHFSLNDEKKLFKELHQKHDVKKSMKQLVKEGDNIPLNISAIIYLISPNLFFKLLRFTRIINIL